MADLTPDEIQQASDAFDAAHAAHEQLAQHEAVLEALEDFVVALAPAALELGVSFAPAGGALATALRVAEKALPLVVARLESPPTTPAPPATKPGL